ncbi:MAG: IS3 family transposase [Leptospiraceae bacterium]|nr:IS3 family transposase [Leptospiraceae bacterium]
MSFRRCSHYLGHSRANYYKGKKRLIKEEEKKAIVIKEVLKIRKLKAKTGTIKLKKEMDKKLSFKIGRDWLFSLMNEYGLAIKKKKRSIKTTNSRHKFPIYRNEIKDLPTNFPGFIIVSDITYIPTLEGNLYLSLLTERNTKKILGYNIGESLIVEESIKALEIALKMLPKTHHEIVYHHSDRGSQYCCYDYVNILKSQNIRISMTEDNHCYENAVAERVNGILKDEFLLDKFPSKELARKSIKQSIKIYNESRLHQTIDYLTPDEAYYKKWSTYFRN